MKVRAVKGFSGVRFNMHAGEVREAERTETVQELLRIGYLEEVTDNMTQNPKPPAPETAAEEPAPEKTEVSNEAKRGKSKRN